ncbi:MAG: hypothetical protein HZA49_08635 [Planctomycetes bacterium]|nr:hypothetical protein [Planctomycetota bacterium]
MDITELVARKRKESLTQGILLTLLGLVFLAFGFMVFNVLYFIMGLFVLPHINLNIFSWRSWYIGAGIFIAILIIDTVRHPEEHWVKVKFILASAFKKESGPVVHETFPLSDTILYPTRFGKGVFGGMPYMTNMSDPTNWASQISRFANLIGNLTLGGPRKLKEAISYYRLYAGLNQDMASRLSKFVNNLQQQGGECIMSDCPLADSQIIPLAIELNIVSVFKKLNSEDYGIRLSNPG